MQLSPCSGAPRPFQPPKRIVHWLDASNQPLPYERVWKWQKRRVQAMIRAPQKLHDAAIVIQHEPVYTLGAGSSLEHLKTSLRHPLVRTERGGEVTYHGPGQLVLYPLMDLHSFRLDLHWYLRNLEEVAIVALREVSGIEGERLTGMTGVWVQGAKIAAIGIRAKRWVTYHGLALNVAMDLRPFDDIVPCGIPHRSVTSVQELLSPHCTIDASALLKEYSYALMEAFGDVFEVEVREVEGFDGDVSGGGC